MNLTTVAFMTVIAIGAVAFVWYTFFGEQPGYKETDSERLEIIEDWELHWSKQN